MGLVDLPIQRSAATDLPIGQSSGIRGLLRSVLELQKREELARELFGPEPGVPETRAGYVDFTDAKLLVMPVRSVVGLFCWLTCPTSLNEFREALQRLEEVTGRSLTELGLPSEIRSHVGAILERPPSENKALVPVNSENCIEGRITLLDGELDLEAVEAKEASSLADTLSSLLLPAGYLSSAFKRRFAVVGDDSFKLATKRGLEVATRVKLELKTKTVEAGALWTEEYLPAMSALFCEVFIHSRGSKETIESFNEFIKTVDGGRVFVGGKESVGKGLVSLKAYYERP